MPRGYEAHNRAGDMSDFNCECHYRRVTAARHRPTRRGGSDCGWSRRRSRLFRARVRVGCLRGIRHAALNWLRETRRGRAGPKANALIHGVLLVVSLGMNLASAQLAGGRERSRFRRTDCDLRPLRFERNSLLARARRGRIGVAFSRRRGEATKYLIRDRDCIYGTIVARRLRAMGIRDKPTAPASPWPNGDRREKILLIWMRSRGVILFLPRAMDDALSRRLAER
jgi:hypothetical protein